MNAPAHPLTQALERPHLDLSGPKLRSVFELLVKASDEHGGIERYVAAVQLKSMAFEKVLGGGRVADMDANGFRDLCASLPTVRRRMGDYLSGDGFEHLQKSLITLLTPQDRAHRWVRDLAVETLHNVDPARYPMMNRWVWDRKTNTGALREIWFADNLDQITIEVPDGYETFVVLREELSQFLTDNGIFRNVLHYVDLLLAQVYAMYISEQGSDYLRASFNEPSDPLEHSRRLLGLDVSGRSGRSRLKYLDGTVTGEQKSLIRPENLLESDKELVIDGVDVTGHWSTFIEPRVVTDYNEAMEEEIQSLPGGEKINRCWQCGSCTNSCTVNAINSDFNPRYWIYLIRMGMESEILRDKEIIWQCVSCNKCTYVCPREVEPEGVMKATAHWLELKGHTKPSPSTLFDTEFAEQVINTGKIEEGRIIRGFFKRTGQPLAQDWLIEMAKRIARKFIKEYVEEREQSHRRRLQLDDLIDQAQAEVDAPSTSTTH